jgi:hypothetical protein
VRDLNYKRHLVERLDAAAERGLRVRVEEQKISGVSIATACARRGTNTERLRGRPLD